MRPIYCDELEINFFLVSDLKISSPDLKLQLVIRDV